MILQWRRQGLYVEPDPARVGDFVAAITRRCTPNQDNWRIVEAAGVVYVERRPQFGP